MTAPHPRIALAAQLFGVGDRLIRESLKDLTRDELFQRPGQGSHMFWIFGHLTNSRCGLLTMLGRPHEMPCRELFGRGSELTADAEYPELDVVHETWNKASQELQERLEQLTEEGLEARAPRDFPIPDKTIGGAINFLAYHESYHAGQLGYLRKWLGRGSVAG